MESAPSKGYVLLLEQTGVHKIIRHLVQLDSKITEDDALYSPMSASSGSRTIARKINAGVQIAPELSDIVVYLQATKFKVKHVFRVDQSFHSAALSPIQQTLRSSCGYRRRD